MRRKVIQIADSTQLISLPRKWAQRYGIKKGDELEIIEEGSNIIISTEKGEMIEKATLNIDSVEPLALRYVVALYKKGIDEINVTFSKPEKIRIVQNAIGKEAVGYEITEQTKNSCIIKHVSGELEEFEPVLKRTILMMVSMAEQTLDGLKEGRFEELKNASYMEEANNRFTTTCRRLLNKKGYREYKNTGPIYYIIEELEKIADEYKYLCLYFSEKKKGKIKFSDETLSLLNDVNGMFKKFSEIFYNYNIEDIVKLGRMRKEIIEKAFDYMESTKNVNDIVLLHHVIVLAQRIFCLIGPYLVMVL